MSVDSSPNNNVPSPQPSPNSITLSSSIKTIQNTLVRPGTSIILVHKIAKELYQLINTIKNKIK